MAVVKGQAVRRREGVAPNTLVMAQEQSPAGRSTAFPCPVGRCKHVSDTGNLLASSRDLDLHLATRHPRHDLGKAAAQMIGGY